ncbi:MAG: hypothetical protein P8Y98_00035 [Anaerolineales bacterium]|jgi:hypothetical protein
MNEDPVSAQTHAMMSGIRSSSRTPLYSGVAVTGSASIAAGLGFSVVYILNKAIEPVVLTIASDVGMGLAAGLAARFSLPRRSAALRWLVALFGLCTGLIFMGWLSRGLLGMNLIDRTSLEPDWDGLQRFAFGALAAWPAVSAWNQRRRDRRTSSQASSYAPTMGRTVHRRGNQRGNARVASKRAMAMSMPATSARTHMGGRAKVRKSPPRSAGVKSRGRNRSISASIHLATKVDHRCPYCLEHVDPNDPRGVVECTTCHTLHHADCWGVTGTCQVPHHNS